MTQTAAPRNATMIVVSAAIILALSLGVRHGFGLFLAPVSAANGWDREVFAFAIALQNLVWGLAQPAAGYLSDRHGAGRVILAGALLYAAGLAGMASFNSPAGFTIAAGLLVGLGLAGTTFPIVFAVVARALPADQRSLAFGVTMAIGALGQFLMLPAAVVAIEELGWKSAFLAGAAIVVLAIPLSFWLFERPRERPAVLAPENAKDTVRHALANRSFQLLSLGFFVCGFHVVFIVTHLPAYLADMGLTGPIAARVLALIGLFNVAGTLAAGWLGAHIAKPVVLTWIYLGRALAIAAFVLLPASAASAYVFACAMGLLWLATVPLTNAIVATMFGERSLGMLGGLVFLAHQLGSFLGSWLGGAMYANMGSYDAAWGVAILLGLIAALVNLPVRERPVAPRPQGTAA